MFPPALPEDGNAVLQGIPRPPEPNDAIAALRIATRQAHAHLDQHLPLSRADPTLADYATHLRTVRDWRLRLSPWLARTSSDPAALALIAQDLLECPAPAKSPLLPFHVDLQTQLRADDGSDAFCWGIAYVVEGSRLGGQVLYRRLCGPLAPHPLRYLGKRSKDTVPWPVMLASLRRNLAGDAACAAGCAGAVAAFETLLLRFRMAGCLP